MSALQTVADVFGIEVDESGSREGSTIVVDWGGRKIEYRVALYGDVVTENLYVGLLKFPGYLRGLLVVDRRGSAEVVQLHLYDGSRKKVAEVRKGSLGATFAAAAVAMTSSHQFFNDTTPEWVPIDPALAISA